MMPWLSSHKELIALVAYLLLPVLGQLLVKRFPLVGKVLQSVGLDHFKVAAALVQKETGVDVMPIVTELAKPAVTVDSPTTVQPVSTEVPK